jgi:hypothetical protein
MKKIAQTSIVLNALALAGMLVFASQAADAASTGTQTSTTVHHTQSVTNDSSPDVSNMSSKDVDTHDVDTNEVDTNEVDNSGDIGDIGNQDIDTPDVPDTAEIPDVGESN